MLRWPILSLFLDVFQGDYDPAKTKVMHFRLNPTSIAKQQRAEDLEQLRVECERLRDRLRKMEAGGAVATDDTTLIIPPSQEILGGQCLESFESDFVFCTIKTA